MAHTIGGIPPPSSTPFKVAAGSGSYGGPIFRQKPTFRHARRHLAAARAWLGFPAPRPALPAPALPPDLVEPVIAPALGIDGWTYQGTPLEERFTGATEAELAPLMHAICAGMATTWTYERAAKLMESEEAYTQAYAVLAAGIAAGAVPEDAGVVRWRARLGERVLRRGWQ